MIILAGAVHSFLQLFNPKTVAVCSHSYLQPGSEFEISWLQKGMRRRLRNSPSSSKAKNKSPIARGPTRGPKPASFSLNASWRRVMLLRLRVDSGTPRFLMNRCIRSRLVATRLFGRCKFTARSRIGPTFSTTLPLLFIHQPMRYPHHDSYRTQVGEESIFTR